MQELIKFVGVCATGASLFGSGSWSRWCVSPRPCLQWDRAKQEDPIRGEANIHHHPFLHIPFVVLSTPRRNVWKLVCACDVASSKPCATHPAFLSRQCSELKTFIFKWINMPVSFRLWLPCFCFTHRLISYTHTLVSGSNKKNKLINLMHLKYSVRSEVWIKPGARAFSSISWWSVQNLINSI